MRSVYLKILLWCFITLLLSLVGIRDGFDFRFRSAARGGFFTDIHAWQTAEAAEAYESGGSPGLGRVSGKPAPFPEGT